ncbi:uncharacterized protein METZ01_LOCUS333923, partial [marine metagenome]
MGLQWLRFVAVSQSIKRVLGVYDPYGDVDEEWRV